MNGPESPFSQNDCAELYLDLLKKCLTRLLFAPLTAEGSPAYRPQRFSVTALRKMFGPAYLAVLRHAPFQTVAARVAEAVRRRVERHLPIDYAARFEGRDWPRDAETMIGMRRLNNLHQCIVDVLREEVPGDFIETGIWRGGATIFMRGALRAYGVANRAVWVADSFSGLPKPTADSAPADRRDVHWLFGQLAVSLDEVRGNFQRYGLLDEQVRFLPGWFAETLPRAPIEKLAILRLDGDMYGSTMSALQALYPKLSPGGFVIVDDYYEVQGCRLAVDEFRAKERLTEPMMRIDSMAVFWRRREDSGQNPIA